MPRQTDWVDTTIARSVASGAQDFFSLATGMAPINLRGATLIRTIIRLDLHSATVAGAWGVQRLQMGIGITSQEAFAAGVLPDPVTAGDKPSRGWIWRGSIAVAQNGIGSPVMFDLSADIRASRKIENGELFIVFDSAPGGGTAFTVGLNGLIRTLIKLA